MTAQTRRENSYRNGFIFQIGETGIVANGDTIRNHYLLCGDNVLAAFSMRIGETKELEFVSASYSVCEPMRYTQIVTRIR